MKELQNEKHEALFYTTYKEAAHWLHNNLILQNDICEIDNQVYDYMRFSTYNEDDETYTEIFQWFITDCSKDDVEYLEKHFGLLFTYSPLLDKYILCVDHWGTSWDCVSCPVYGDKSNNNYPHCKTYKELTGYEY